MKEITGSIPPLTIAHRIRIKSYDVSVLPKESVTMDIKILKKYF